MMERLPLRRRTVLSAAGLLLFCSSLQLVTAAHRWPQFRGPGGSGIGEGDFPTWFGPGTNEAWSVPVPPGHASPILWDDRLILTGFADGKLLTLCLDRRDGRELWRQSVEPGLTERGSRLSSPAASTPVTDGQRVHAYFGPFGLVTYDLAGRELWRKPLPTPVTQHGASSSPILAGGRVIVARDQDVDSHLLALDAETGREVWRVDRPTFRRSFSTPLPWPSVRPNTVILPGTLRLVAYNLSDGSERWQVSGLPNETVASAVEGDGLIFFAGWTPGSGVKAMPTFEAQLALGDRDADQRLAQQEAPPGPARQHFNYIDANKDGHLDRDEWEALARIFDASQNTALAVRPDGSGDVTSTHVVWRQNRGLPYVPTPLCYEGRFFLVRNGGLVSCFEAQTGRSLYLEERIDVMGDYYASPVAAGGKIAVASQPGVVAVLRSGDTPDVLARNALGEEILATPAIAGGRIYIRTASHLHAFGR